MLDNRPFSMICHHTANKDAEICDVVSSSLQQQCSAWLGGKRQLLAGSKH